MSQLPDGGLNKQQTSRLKEALDQLPEDLTFLRDAILAIAEQDQDLLGCGEADASVLEEAMQQNSAAATMSDKGASTAEALRRWLRKQPGHRGAWAAPIGFVEGYLRGMDQFGADEAPATKPPNLVLGLHRIEVDVPTGMKTKLYVAGLEMNNREVKIILMELDEGSYEYRWRTPPPPMREEWRAFALPPNWPHPTRFAEEHVIDMPLGEHKVERKLSRDFDTGLVVMSSYLLILPTTKVEVGMFSKKQTGAELTKYEPIIATIREKR